MENCPSGLEETSVEALACPDSGHSPGQEEGRCSAQDGAEVGVDLDGPNQGPDQEVARSVVEGFVLVEGDCHLVFRAVDRVDRQLHRRSQVEVVVGAAKHCVRVELLLFACLVLAQSFVVAFGGPLTACEAFSRGPVPISEAQEPGLLSA
jgi:hypothetical protein